MDDRNYSRVYNKEKNVLEASIDRLDFIFNNFERIYLSFSGGKDSGVMLNLVIDYMRSKGITEKILDKNTDILDIYWCCMPVTLPCTVSSYAFDWQCWGERDKERWIRPMPDMPYVVNFENHDFDFFVEDMNYDHFWDGFAEWYAQGKTCANLIGIRTAESLNRFRAILNDRKETMQGMMWTKKNTEHVYNCYPIFDWKTDDVWTANGLFDWNYNKLYDLFYKAGVPIGSMRVASPFMSEGKSSLGLYRVIDPHTWAKLCARVQVIGRSSCQTGIHGSPSLSFYLRLCRRK